jgi:photosystem II stability/assembly factor-like uncharacterized protein
MRRVFSLVWICVAWMSGPALAGWELMNVEVNDGNQLLDVSMVTERSACTVGVFKSPSSGNSQPRIMCTQNSGESWSAASLDGVFNFPVAVSMATDQVGYLTSLTLPDPKVYRTDNGGRAWAEQVIPVVDAELLGDIFFLDENTGWAVGGSSAIYTVDGGTNWNPSSVPSLDVGQQVEGVFFVDTVHGWAVGGNPGTEGDEFTDPVPAHDGFLLRSMDGGQTWQMSDEGYTGALHRIWFSDSQNGWAVGGGEAGLILHTGDGGDSWAEQTVPAGPMGTADFVADVAFPDAQNGYAVGNIGQGTPMVLMTEDGGGTWTVDTTYEQAFEGLSGMDVFAKWAMLSGLSFPRVGRGMVCGQHMVIAAWAGQGFCPDNDADGHMDESCGGDDCDDGNQYVHPDAEELCNGLDENCDDVPDESFDFDRDPMNCGECGFNCQPAQVCWDAECVLECPGELTRCGQECVELDSHPRHCGECDHACEYPNAAGSCQASECSMGECARNWYDLDGSEANGCEYSCAPSGEEACDGVDNDCDGETDEDLAGCTGEESSTHPDGGSPDGGSTGGDLRQYEPGSSGCSHTRGSGIGVVFWMILMAGLAIRRNK